MRIAYLDCFSGISGDMTLGALIDAGLSIEDLREDLGRLGLPGFDISALKVQRGGIGGTGFIVHVSGQDTCRGYGDIISIINESSLPEPVKEMSRRAFHVLGSAEAQVHGVSIDDIHFHEVGAIDSIVDIVGVMAGLHRLGVERVYASPPNLGGGFVRCAHGELPVPAPATARILLGLPAYSRGTPGELTTPTGACLLKTLTSGFGDMPVMRVQAVGYGAGEREMPFPNLLRVMIGEMEEQPWQEDAVTQIETNVDDMSPEIMGWLTEKLLDEGALDAFLTPVIMKKGRPGVMLTVLSDPGREAGLVSLIFKETTTIGVRIQALRRKKLGREIVHADTPFGPVAVKVSRGPGGVVTASPEFESCRWVAREKGVPLREVFGAAALGFSLQAADGKGGADGRD